MGIGLRKAIVPVQDRLAKEKKNGYKLFQSSPRDRRKLGDILFPLWLLLEISLVLVPSLSIVCPWCTNLSMCVNLCLFSYHYLNYCCSVFHVEKKKMVKTITSGYPPLDLV